MKKTTTRLADGRELIYYDSRDDTVRDAVDPRPAGPVSTASEIRHDPLLGDTRRHRLAPPGPHLPPAGRRVPAVPLPRRPAQRDPRRRLRRRRLREPLPLAAPATAGPLRGGLLHLRPRRLLRRPHPGAGRPGPGRLDRPHRRAVPTPGRGTGLLLREPRRARSASPSATRTARSTPTPSSPRAPARCSPRSPPTATAPAAATSSTTSSPTRRADGRRIVLDGEHWTAFVPYAAHWPYEVHLYPRRRVPDLLALDADAARRVPARLPGTPAPLRPDLRPGRTHAQPPDQADPPPLHLRLAPGARHHAARPREFALHLELFTIRRTPAS